MGRFPSIRSGRALRFGFVLDRGALFGPWRHIRVPGFPWRPVVRPVLPDVPIWMAFPVLALVAGWSSIGLALAFRPSVAGSLRFSGLLSGVLAGAAIPFRSLLAIPRAFAVLSLFRAFFRSAGFLFLFPAAFFIGEFDFPGDDGEADFSFPFEVCGYGGADFKVCGFFTAQVHFFHLAHLVEVYGIDLPTAAFMFIYIEHDAFEDIRFYEDSPSFLSFDAFGMLRECFEGVEVGVEFVVEAALEPAALTGQFRLVDCQVLVSCGGGGNRLEVREPGRAAQFASAGADASDAGGFLSGTDLAHFNFHPELFGEVPDEFAEVHAAIGGIIESSLSLIPLDFHVADFHIEAQGTGDGAGTHHERLFHFPGFLEPFHISFVGAADDRIEHGGFVDPFFLHLVADQFTGEGDFTDVESIACFHDGHIPCGDAHGIW